MSQVRMVNVESLPNIPWEDKPLNRNVETPVWRYSKNPILGRNPTPEIGRVFNSAVIPWKDGFVAALRGEQIDGIPLIYLGRSKDGIQWEVDRQPIPFKDENGKLKIPKLAYDPRLVKIEDTYYFIWCTLFYGAAIGMGSTKDFEQFTRLENPFMPFNRNAVLFPRKIDGKFKMLSRPSDNGHTPFGDIFISETPDMKYWGCHRHVMGPGKAWQGVKIGAGAAPIETTEGWLLFYHGVNSTCDGFVYSMGACILDINQPSKVLYRCNNYLLTPEEPYETTGFVPNVVFPCATLQDGDTGRIAIYYGAADTHVGLAFTTVDEVVRYVKEHSVLNPGDEIPEDDY